MTNLLKHDEFISALQSNIPLMAAVSGIYDNPPASAAAPYIVVGNTKESSDELIDNSGAEIETILHIWSTGDKSGGGRKRVLEVRALILDALPNWMLYDGIEIFRDPSEPNWWHGAMTLRYYDRR